MDCGDWGCLTPIILQPVCINQTNLAHLTVYPPCKHPSGGLSDRFVRRLLVIGSTRAITAVWLFVDVA